MAVSTADVGTQTYLCLGSDSLFQQVDLRYDYSGPEESDGSLPDPSWSDLAGRPDPSNVIGDITPDILSDNQTDSSLHVSDSFSQHFDPEDPLGLEILRLKHGEYSPNSDLSSEPDPFTIFDSDDASEGLGWVILTLF